MNRWAGGMIVTAAVGLSLSVTPVRGQQVSPKIPITAAGLTPADVFDPQRIWSFDLRFTAEQWAALQPTYGGQEAGTRNLDEWLQGREGGRNGLAAARGVEFDYVHADLQIDGRSFRDIGVRYKGNGTFMRSRGTGKTPFKIDLNRYVKGQKLAGLTTINLQNAVTDASWMIETLAYRLYRDAGVDAPRTTFARVYVTVDGVQTRQYMGLYSITENIDANFMDERVGTRKGAILKPVTRQPFAMLGTEWAAYNQTYDPKTDLTTLQERRVIDFSRLVTEASDEEFTARLGEYLDIEQFARYFAVLAWLGNIDSLLDRGQNYYVYLTADTGRLQFLPWDQDGSFGNFGRRWGGGAEQMNVHRPWSSGIRFLDRLWTVEAFRTAYYARLEEFSRTIFTPERFVQQVDELAPIIRPVVAEESTWHVTAFDRVVSRGAGIKRFAAQRHEAVLAQLAQPR